MLRVRNCKTLLLAALLIGAAGNAFASGVFSVSPTLKVEIAPENLRKEDREHFQWTELDDENFLPPGQRVLEADEWNYLFGYDPDYQRANAYDLFALARIETSSGVYKNGLIILPDDWVLPTGITWNNSATQGGYEKNTYTPEQWDLMAANGAVFLHAAGYSTDGTTITDLNEHGSYWTATANSTHPEKALRIQLDETYFFDYEGMPKVNYYSVRAVTDVPTAPILSENDEQETVVEKLAIMRANNFADLHRTLRKAGCFNTLTLPFNVPSIEASPLAGAEAYRFVSAEVEDGSLVLNITKVTNNQLVAGTPYLIQWANTGEVMTDFHFADVTWDADDNADTNGSGDVLFHGFYGKTHITDENAGFGHHFHLFLLGNNTLYWPTDGNDPAAKMLGFRAWFDIVNNTVSGAPVRRDMPARLNIVSSFGGATDIEAVSGDSSLRTKTIEDGTLYILHRGKKYNVQGQIVK